MACSETYKEGLVLPLYKWQFSRCHSLDFFSRRKALSNCLPKFSILSHSKSLARVLVPAFA